MGKSSVYPRGSVEALRQSEDPDGHGFRPGGLVTIWTGTTRRKPGALVTLPSKPGARVTAARHA